MDPFKTPTKSTTRPNPPPPPSLVITKLTHPTKIKREQLTANTFRLYMGWYMERAPRAFADNLAYIQAPRTSSARRKPSVSGSPETPKATQRSSIPIPTSTTIARGMTISHLRRVPELILLARRIVRQKDRKRTLEDKSGTEPPEKKMMRLFSQTVKQLMDAGSMVLWNDQAKIPAPVVEATHENEWSFDWNHATCARGLSSKHATISRMKPVTPSMDLSAVSSTSTQNDKRDWREDIVPFLEELSHHKEREDEDAYAAVCPEVLAESVERTVQRIRETAGSASRTTSRPQILDIETIARNLRGRDARWARVSSDDVGRTLDWLANED